MFNFSNYSGGAGFLLPPARGKGLVWWRFIRLLSSYNF